MLAGLVDEAKSQLLVGEVDDLGGSGGRSLGEEDGALGHGEADQQHLSRLAVLVGGDVQAGLDGAVLGEGLEAVGLDLDRHAQLLDDGLDLGGGDGGLGSHGGSACLAW